MFYIKLKDIDSRSKFIKFTKENEVSTVFHYIPLHSSIAGSEFGTFNDEDIFTSQESERLVRLPLYFNISVDELDKVVDTVKVFHEGNS